MARKNRVDTGGAGQTSQADELYCRGEFEVDSRGISIKAGGQVRFYSYFNALFYPKYSAYCGVERVRLNAWIEGRAELKIVCANASEERIVWQSNASGGICSEWIDTTKLLADGALFLELTAISDVRLGECRWEAEREPKNEIKVAAVICTYRREEYVRRNLEKLEGIWSDESPIRDELDVLVVDNGRTLELEEREHVRLIPNKNCGGSGGFTRGLIEAHRAGKYTHVLFMDDDIGFEPEIFVKTIQFLKLAKRTERPLCIGGQMLIESSPTMQYESGGYRRNGRLQPINQGFDLAVWETLIENERAKKPDYQAWWFCCFETSRVDEVGLPLPLFIKSDDVEYGLRNKFDIVTMNGIGVWHTAFDEKYSGHLEYYIKRNELIVSSLYREGDGLGACIWKLIRACAKALIKTEPRTVHFLLRAYKDFLKGPEFLMNTDPEELNAELLKKKAEMKVGSRVLGVLGWPFKALPVIVEFVLCGKSVQGEWRERVGEVCGVWTWEKILEI